MTATALALLTASACASPDSNASSDGKPVRGGELSYLVEQTQLTLDPAVSPAAVTGLIGRQIFDSLVVQSGPEKFEPWLATKWTISPNGREYTFELRKGLHFSDGTPFDAKSVKSTLDHVVKPATKSQYAASLIAPYKSATVVDDSTVKVTLSKPFRPFLQALSTPYLGIQSPKALARPAADYRPVGTGPFVFESWSQQKNVSLKRNPDYDSAPSNAPHEGPAYLDEINFNHVPEDATRYGALTSGQAQAIAAVPPKRVQGLESDPQFQVLRAQQPGANYNLYLNVNHGPTSDPLVRRAIQAAVDIPGLVRNIYAGEYEAATNSLSPTTPAFDATAAKSLQAFAPSTADDLLDQAGWTGRSPDGYRTKAGKELTLTWPYLAQINREQRDVLGQAIQAQANDVGIRIERPNLDSGTYTDRVLKGTYHILDISNARADADILRFTFASDATFAKGGANISTASSPQLDAWLNQGAATSDSAAAKRAYARAQAHVLREAYVLPGYVPTYLLGASEALHGVHFDPQAIPSFHGAWLTE